MEKKHLIEVSLFVSWKKLNYFENMVLKSQILKDLKLSYQYHSHTWVFQITIMISYKEEEGGEREGGEGGEKEKEKKVKNNSHSD